MRSTRVGFVGVIAFGIASITSSAACVHERFREIATQAAAQRTTKCDSSTAVETYPLSEDWAFRIDTCEGPTYWRCWFKRHSAGREQCCARVASEEEATAFLSPSLDYDPSAFCGGP